MPEPLFPLLAAHPDASPAFPAALAVVVVTAVLLGAFLLHVFAFKVLHRQVDGTGAALTRSLLRRARLPVGVILPLVGVEIALALLPIGEPLRNWILHILGIGITVAVAFLFVRLTYVVEDVILERHRLDTADNLRARQLHTQIQILRRITVVAVTVVAAAVVLLSFSAVRVAGASLLASAGLIGLVVGMAARPTVANVIAGIQIALSQPIRVDDVVVVEGQWGRVEQIALTYVVVRLWDLRRLVLPIVYFVENPFENWTRSTADIIGWAYVEVDHTAPVGALRDRLHEILSASPNWDGHVWNLQVSNAGTSTIQLRAMMSSPSSSASWDLQCEVREQLVAFLRDHHPGALPRVRTEGAAEREHLSSRL
jgi:small-conductance mechanosensitive channel